MISPSPHGLGLSPARPPAARPSPFRAPWRAPPCLALGLAVYGQQRCVARRAEALSPLQRLQRSLRPRGLGRPSVVWSASQVLFGRAASVRGRVVESRGGKQVGAVHAAALASELRAGGVDEGNGRLGLSKEPFSVDFDGLCCVFEVARSLAGPRRLLREDGAGGSSRTALRVRIQVLSTRVDLFSKPYTDRLRILQARKHCHSFDF